ncbi:MAG: hypothetical protein H8E44_11610 [Planctomycetes bacterium]|nr:hypothetical protein [Planctomycetota bacterium]
MAFRQDASACLIDATSIVELAVAQRFGSVRASILYVVAINGILKAEISESRR